MSGNSLTVWGEAELSGCLDLSPSAEGPLAKPCGLSEVSRQPDVCPRAVPLEDGVLGSVI